MKELIFELCSTMGVSGSEEPIAELCCEKLRNYADVSIDKNGNVIAVMGNKESSKTILLDAHMDRIGLIVTGINDKGFVKVESCGGIDLRTLLDTLVVSQSSGLIGVVCCNPPHLSDGNEDKATPMDKVWIDFGLPYDEIIGKISIGDVLSFYSSPKMLLNNRICAPSLDNRCGIAALIKCAELLSDKQLDYKVVILLSTQEETFGTGAKTGAFSVTPDEAIVVDVSFASQPDVSGQYAGIELSKGPMICIAPVLSKKMTDKLISIAKDSDIPFQYEPIASSTGTNADSIAVSKSGTSCALVSIPQRNMHTPNEIIDISDVENTAKLIAEYIICGGAFND